MNLREKSASNSITFDSRKFRYATPPHFLLEDQQIFYFFVRNHFLNLARLYNALNGNEKNSFNNIDGNLV